MYGVVPSQVEDFAPHLVEGEVRFSSLVRSLWTTAGPSGISAAPPSLVSSANLLRVRSASSSRSLIKMLSWTSLQLRSFCTLLTNTAAAPKSQLSSAGAGPKPCGILRCVCPAVLALLCVCRVTVHGRRLIMLHATSWQRRASAGSYLLLRSAEATQFTDHLQSGKLGPPEWAGGMSHWKQRWMSSSGVNAMESNVLLTHAQTAWTHTDTP